MGKQVSKLGTEVKDRVSGFRGIVISETKYLQGCTRMSVQPPVKKDGTLPDPKHFDEPDLMVVGSGVAAGGTDPGGPRDISPVRD